MASERASEPSEQASEQARSARNRRYYLAHQAEIIRKRDERQKLAAIDEFVGETLGESDSGLSD